GGASQTGGRLSTGTDGVQRPATSSVEYLFTQISDHKRSVAFGFMILLALVAFDSWVYIKRSTSLEAINSLAVMPFVDATGAPDIEYLSDGMTEMLISSLSQLPRLNVKARSSVFRYKGRETNPRSIGKELNVQAILNGRFVQHGEQLTLSLELI